MQTVTSLRNNTTALNLSLQIVVIDASFVKKETHMCTYAKKYLY